MDTETYQESKSSKDELAKTAYCPTVSWETDSKAESSANSALNCDNHVQSKQSSDDLNVLISSEFTLKFDDRMSQPSKFRFSESTYR